MAFGTNTRAFLFLVHLLSVCTGAFAEQGVARHTTNRNICHTRGVFKPIEQKALWEDHQVALKFVSGSVSLENFKVGIEEALDHAERAAVLYGAANLTGRPALAGYHELEWEDQVTLIKVKAAEAAEKCGEISGVLPHIKDPQESSALLQ